MGRHLIIFACMLWGMGQALAQDFAEDLKNNPGKSASNHRSYEFVESELTPTPKGYKAFYISHYSRHGSRYHTSERYFNRCMPQMAVCDSLGLLSEQGKAWYNEAKIVMQEHQNMFGMLTTLGTQEQDGIGRRIYERFPEVFAGKNGRVEVRNRSTRVQRSIVSMASFNTAIAKKAPSLKFSYAAGDKYREYLNADGADYQALSRFKDQVEASMKHLINTDRVYQMLFNNPESALKATGDPYSFAKGIFYVTGISPNTDAHPDMFGYFHPEDLYGYWCIRNNGFYAGYANSLEMAEQVATIARPLIADIIVKAEEALKDGSRLAADFRFGHDTGLLPLVATIGIKGMEQKWSAYEAHKHWSSSEMIPMASNLQMIFYRNKKGDILVKLLYNEKETAIPALKPECGPYYKWSILKDYLLTL